MALYARFMKVPQILHGHLRKRIILMENECFFYSPPTFRNAETCLAKLYRQDLKLVHLSSVGFKRRKTAEEKKAPRAILYPPKPKSEMVNVWRDITAGELATVLEKDFSYVKDLFFGVINKPNTVINDMQLLQQAIKRSGHRMRIVAKPLSVREDYLDKDASPRPPPNKSDLKPRPPVVTVMGHVDHGKTTLLDALRHSNVVEKEFGGITQHIGAFSVTLQSGARVTFLDTPGHAAFSNMRARGANLTDIVVLVVAADDGVMEQTVESVRMARNAGVPILVAINKIDAPKADIERTERMLVEVGIQVEKMGGDVQAIPISALKKKNLDQLVEALILQAELLEIGADPAGPAEAVVVESKVHSHRGKLCTVVVQRGTLKKGKVLVAGTAMGRVRQLRDADGNILSEVTPGFPAEIEGWKELPSAGELVLEVESEKRARQVVEIREQKMKIERLQKDAKVISEKEEQHQKQYQEKLSQRRRMGRFRSRQEGPRLPELPKDDDTEPYINIIVKGDVDGTLEAVLDTLDTYNSSQCKMDIVHYGVGAVTLNDLELASTFKCVIYAFNVDCPKNILQQAEDSAIKIKQHNVIYKLVDDVKEEINVRLPLKEIEDVLGEASVLQQFEINEGRKKVPVAGCKCEKGVLKRSAKYRLIRNGEILFEGQLASMRHLKAEVDVIKSDTECGLQLEDRTLTFEKGDRIICFEIRSEPQQTDWDPGF